MPRPRHSMADDPEDGGDVEGQGAVSTKMVGPSKENPEEIAALREHIWKMRHPDESERMQLWPRGCHVKEADLKGIATQRMYEWEDDDFWYRAYEVEVHKFMGLKYKLNFKNAKNLEISGAFGENDRVVKAVLQPYELETVCLVQRNKRDSFKLAVKMQWITCDPHPDVVKWTFDQNKARIARELEAQEAAGVRADMETGEIRRRLRDGGLKFVDPDFVPSREILYLEGEQSDRIMVEKVNWRRVDDYMADPAVFKLDDEHDRADVDPSDVLQGRLGDCWFCCSLAAMAERPELIKRLFVTKEINDEGLYEVQFWHDGIRKVIRVDDFFPCKPFMGGLYTKTKEDEIWVALLEKAYAKIYGCYQRLISGSPYHALADMLGMPVDIYEVQDPRDQANMWANFLKWNKREDVMQTVACGDLSFLNPREAGLHSNHSYSLLEAKEGCGVKLVCIRNPWGHSEWKGDWSDHSPLWTAETKAFFKPVFDDDDGLFWMSYEDFLKYFCSVVVAYVREDWSDARKRVTLEFDHGSKAFTTQVLSLTIPDGGVLEWVCTFQQDDREANAKEYLDLSVFVFRKNGRSMDPVAYVGAESARQTMGCFEEGEGKATFSAKLGGGEYHIVPFSSCRAWQQASGSKRNVSISAHAHSCGRKKLKLKTAGTVGKKQLSQMMLDLTMKLGEAKKWHNMERRHLRVGQMDLYAGRNETSDKVLTFTMKGDLSNITNAYGYPDLAEGGEFELQPGEEQLFGVQVMRNPMFAGASSYKFGLKSKPAS